MGPHREDRSAAPVAPASVTAASVTIAAVYVIGLTGGIASGKSVVASRLAELGAVVIDADKLAREVVEPGTPGLAAIRARFGDAVIAADGRVDRAAMGAIVFADDDSRLALNGITHPAIRELTRQRIAEAQAADPEAVIVQDIPLLVETMGTGTARRFDLVVVVEASDETRIRRLVHLRGMTEQEASRRIAAQATNDQRREIADVLIDSDGTLEHTLAQADELWRRVRH